MQYGGAFVVVTPVLVPKTSKKEHIPIYETNPIDKTKSENNVLSI